MSPLTNNVFLVELKNDTNALVNKEPEGILDSNVNNNDYVYDLEI